MEDKKILLDNIDKIHTTEMGIDRIKRIIQLSPHTLLNKIGIYGRCFL